MRYYNPFRVGDIVVYRPSLPKKVIKNYYGRSMVEKIGKRAKVVEISDKISDKDVVGVVFHKTKKTKFIIAASLRLIKGVPRHPLTTIFADQK